MGVEEEEGGGTFVLFYKLPNKNSMRLFPFKDKSTVLIVIFDWHLLSPTCLSAPVIQYRAVAV